MHGYPKQDKGVIVMSNKRKKRKVQTVNDEQTPSNAAETAQLEAGVLDETAVDSAATPAIEEADSTELYSGIPLSDDMEAAMEEDIAGEAVGVSRRNPSYPSVPSMGLYDSSLRPPRTEMRTGSQEADWFNRFRERLATDNEPVYTSVSPTDADAAEQYDSNVSEDEIDLYS